MDDVSVSYIFIIYNNANNIIILCNSSNCQSRYMHLIIHPWYDFTDFDFDFLVHDFEIYVLPSKTPVKCIEEIQQNKSNDNEPVTNTKQNKVKTNWNPTQLHETGTRQTHYKT